MTDAPLFNSDRLSQFSILIALLVAHTPLLHLDPFQIIQQTRARLVVDCVNGWDAGNWKRAGFQYFRLGAPATSF